MYKLLVCFFVFFTSLGAVAQTMTGTIYDDKEAIEGVLVKNQTTKMSTLSPAMMQELKTPVDYVLFYCLYFVKNFSKIFLLIKIELVP